MINIAEQFTRYPAGRFHSDGPFSGEKFREEFLVPVLEAGKKEVIELDGTRGYGSSFLEEAFGGLVRMGYSNQRVLGTFEFETNDKSLVLEIKEYISQASPE